MSDSHPESQEGEVFLKNCSDEEYEEVKFKTKRQGTQAFDAYGEKIQEPWIKPVFVNAEEYHSKFA